MGICLSGEWYWCGDVQEGSCPSGYRSGTINTRTGRELSRWEFVPVGNVLVGNVQVGELSKWESFSCGILIMANMTMVAIYKLVVYFLCLAQSIPK